MKEFILLNKYKSFIGREFIVSECGFYIRHHIEFKLQNDLDHSYYDDVNIFERRPKWKR